eukprot:Protomagalhaensia_wolfi_Nauph_80__426@NODE_1234_length_1643_cov_295_482544_g948_i0_p1_GENE_NODE_1234_length_1643_cov_295_482544_g948_i0NODE_1234_length_1643_cov_295_482544_g948_i0_p1_ORF_typecomplete_len248_score36_55_NODE_1234_length_1643_cov_295_482544_g948_i0208951
MRGVLSVLLVAGSTRSVIGFVTEAAVESCSTPCALICAECGQSPAREVVSCLDNSLLEGCTATTLLTEAWNVTHYCVTTDGFTGGWGFMAPVVRDIVPAQIKSISLKADLVPTTGAYDVVQEEEFPVSISVAADRSTSPQESILHTCNIENSGGIQGTMLVNAGSIPPECDDGSTPDLTMGCPYSSVEVSLSLNLPLTGTTPFHKTQPVFSVLADTATLANKGVLPPALENASFQVQHVVHSGHSSL